MRVCSTRHDVFQSAIALVVGCPERPVVHKNNPGEMPTFAQYVEKHIVAMCTRVTASTQRTYEICFEHQLSSHFGAVKINKIGELEIEE